MVRLPVKDPDVRYARDRPSANSMVSAVASYEALSGKTDMSTAPMAPTTPRIKRKEYLDVDAFNSAFAFLLRVFETTMVNSSVAVRPK